jgi:hypothetical protein
MMTQPLEDVHKDSTVSDLLSKVSSTEEVCFPSGLPHMWQKWYESSIMNFYVCSECMSYQQTVPGTDKSKFTSSPMVVGMWCSNVLAHLGALVKSVNKL